MGLLPARPKLRLRVPTEIRPGQEFSAVVIVDCRREVEVEGLRVDVTGTELFATDPNQGARRPLVHLAAALSGKRRFPKGRTELTVRIPLPAELPPSHRGVYGRVEYVLTVHAEIAWWPDAKAAFEIVVAPRETSSPALAPVLHASDVQPRPRQPYVELSLACDWTRVGGPVRGAFALSNVAENRYTSATIALRALETLQSSSTRTYPTTSYQHRISVEGRGEAEMIPFEFRLHESAQASFGLAPRPAGAIGLFALGYQLELEVHMPWGARLSIAVPYHVLPRSRHASDAPPRLAPPSVGNDRLRALWEAVGARHGMRYAEGALLGERGHTKIAIERQHRGRAGIFLVAALAYPELHLGLSIEPSSTLSSLVGDVRVGDDAFDAAYVVDGREEGQTRAFLQPLPPYVRGARIASADDRSMVIEVRDAGTNAKPLEGFLARAAALAAQIERARGGIVPPAALAPALESWRELARRLGSPLEVARMRIDGQLEGVGAHALVELHKDEPPRAMWLGVSPSSPIDEQHQFVWSMQQQGASALDQRFSGELRDLVRAACEGATDLRVEPTRVTVALPEIMGLAPAVTPELVERRIGRLARIAAVLRGQHGPYR